MKKLILLLALICNLFSSSNTNEKKIIPLENNFTKAEKEYILSNTITIGMTDEYYPFSFKQKGKISGFSYDYINLITKNSGLKIKIEIGSWSTILEKFRTKQIELIDAISFNKNRESYTNFSKTYFEIPNVIFARKGILNNYTGLESLKGKKIGITKDIYYYDKIKSLELFKIVEFENSRDKMKALAHEKIDAVFNNLISGQKYIKQAGYTNIKILDELNNKIIKKEDLKIGVNKGNDLLFSIINKSMAKITRVEEEQLYNKWFAAKVKSNVIDFTDEENQYLEEKKEITMCIDPDWMPFEKNDNGKHIGMSADYFKLFEKSISTPIRMIPTKIWSESLSLGQKRECDIFSLVMSTSERLKYLDFTKVYLKTPLVIATNNNAFFISSLSELTNKKVGIVKDYAYGELLRIKNPEMNFIDVKNVKEGLEKVENEEIFAFIGSLATIGFQLQNNYIGQLKIAGKIDDMLELSIGIRNDEPILKNIFNKVIDRITIEEDQNILNKWVSINYQEGIQYKTIWKYLIVLIIVIIILILIYRQYLLKDLNKKLNEKVKIEIEKNIRQNEILSQQSKMAAMGEMLSNIAHQWRQPLSIISTASTGTKLQKEMNCLSDEQLETSLTAINDSAQYLSQTIDDFRGFFSPDKKKNEFYISTIIEKTLNLISAQFISKDIQIIKNIEDYKLLSLESKVIQVLINILNNAKDALLLKEDQARLIFINTFKKNGISYIEVLDNAGGIDVEIQKRIFEPYFTTKHQSQGTGIGLYMSQEIVKNHLGGILMFFNETYLYEDIEYTGAKFTIKINLGESSLTM